METVEIGQNKKKMKKKPCFPGRLGVVLGALRKNLIMDNGEKEKKSSMMCV